MLYTAPALAPDYMRVVERIDRLRQQLRYSLQNQPRRWTGLLRRQTFARAVQGSNSIEGYNVTQSDAVAVIEGEPPLDASAEAHLAVAGYWTAMGYILQLADDPYYVHNEGTIRSLHYMMIGYDLAKHPGRWRPGSIHVRHEPTGEIVYEGPDVELVPGLMKDFIDSLNAANDLPCLIRAAMAHLNLVMIHPFSDGNGRMGRALQTMVLARDGILDPRFSSIEEYLGRNTLEYYAVLAEVGQGSWRPGRSSLPWLRFCLTAHYRQAETLLRRSKEMARLWELLYAELKRAGLHERMTAPLIDAGFGYGVRNATYRKIAEISDEVAGKDLRALVDLGYLEPKGAKRGRFYVATEKLRLMRRQGRERRVSTDPFTDDAGFQEPPSEAYLSGFAPD